MSSRVLRVFKLWTYWRVVSGEGRLWFADWTAGEIRRLGAAAHSEVIVEHRSLPLCFDFLPDGALVLASGPRQALLHVNSVNFDFAAGPPSGDIAPGFIALVRPDGQPHKVADDLAFPNGMAVTAAERVRCDRLKADGRRRVTLRHLKSAVAVRRPYEDDFDSDTLEPDDAVHPPSLD
jgi:hypothetical protein